MPTEKAIVSSILEYLNSIPQCCAEKVAGDSKSSGRADINGCYKGMLIKLEIKTPDKGNKPSKKQEAYLRRWANAGALVGVVYEVSFVRTWMTAYMLNNYYSMPGNHLVEDECEANRACSSWLRKRTYALLPAEL